MSASLVSHFHAEENANQSVAQSCERHWLLLAAARREWHQLSCDPAIAAQRSALCHHRCLINNIAEIYAFSPNSYHASRIASVAPEDQHDNAKGRPGGSQDEEQDVAVVTPCASPDRKDSTEVSVARADTSYPANIPAATATSALRLPAAPATDPTDIPTSSDADGAAAGLPVQLWDRAYNDLKREETDLVDVYEKILSRQL